MSRNIFYAKVKENQEFPQNLTRCFTSNACTSASLLKELNDRGLAPTGSNVYLKVPTTDSAGRSPWMQLGIPGSPEIPSDLSVLDVIIEKPEVTIGEASLDFRPYQKVIFAVGLVAFLAGLCSFCYLADRKGYLDELNAYVGGIAVLTGVPAVCFAVIFHPAWLLVKLFGEMPVQKSVAVGQPQK